MDKKYEPITLDLIRMVERDPCLKEMLRASIISARKTNRSLDTNPVYDLESYYTFVNRCAKALPWEISPSGTYRTLYERIDQGMGCLCFVCDQPLEQLRGKGLFHNSLMYYEPFRSWFIRFLSVSGKYLDRDESWVDEFYRNALKNPDFHLSDGTYEDPENWVSFNDFFARKLSDPSKRPIAFPDNGTVVVSPADSVPQGVWRVDENGIAVQDGSGTCGAPVKTGTLADTAKFLGKSGYRDAFRGGALVHSFLDVNDYHRYHFPVSGTVKEVTLIRQDDAPGGIVVWDEKEKRYRLQCMDRFGWQSIETRGIVIVETDHGGLVAVAPVGMSQVSSVNFEKEVEKGRRVRKGDPLGYFLFGGSDIVMLFSRGLSFRCTAETGKHIRMGEEYGRIVIPGRDS